MGSRTQTGLRVLIADDHPVFREGLALLLAAEPGFEVAAKCGVGEEALAAISGTPVDLVLLNIDGGCGLEFAGRARELGFAGKIFVLTGGVSEPDVARLLASGVCGICLKHRRAEILMAAIRCALDGDVWTDPQLSRPRSGKELTMRERQVLAGIFEGLLNKEIAWGLGISEAAVKFALQQLFARFGVRTRGQLVRIAARHFDERLQERSSDAIGDVVG